LGAWATLAHLQAGPGMNFATVKKFRKKAAIVFVDPSEADWIDDAVWVGDTTLIGVSDGLVSVLTRVDDGDGTVDDEQSGAWDELGDDLLRLVRRLQLRDLVAQALGSGLLEAEDLAWAEGRAGIVGDRAWGGETVRRSTAREKVASRR
jgi:hypothetical protein